MTELLTGVSGTIGQFDPIMDLEQPKDIGNDRIRFEVRRESVIFARHHEILFAKSADHYTQALVQVGPTKKWAIRHSTLKEFFRLLSTDQFIRLNRFYIVNKSHFSHIDFPKKILLLQDGSSVPIIHRISPFVLASIKM